MHATLVRSCRPIDRNGLDTGPHYVLYRSNRCIGPRQPTLNHVTTIGLGMNDRRKLAVVSELSGMALTAAVNSWNARITGISIRRSLR